MDTEKVVVVLLLVAILLSIVTLTITLTANVVVSEQSPVVTDDLGTASVVLDIVRNPAKGDLG
jgi:hypothetical protein